jgi:phosphoglycolate phosphatase-like HAD superfamily hydrolase
MRLMVFDIDGTIMLNGPVAGDLFVESFSRVVGHPPIDGIHFHGNTDRGIFRAMLDGRGDFDALYPVFSKEFAGRMRTEYAAAKGPYVLDGARELIESLHTHHAAALALGTGNVRETAYTKLRRFGLDSYFPVGGFGGDHELRADLVRAAVVDARAHYDIDFDPAETWVIGDTAADVAAAHAAGCRVMAVMTGPHRESELSGADLIVENLEATSECIGQLLG